MADSSVPMPSLDSTYVCSTIFMLFDWDLTGDFGPRSLGATFIGMIFSATLYGDKAVGVFSMVVRNSAPDLYLVYDLMWSAVVEIFFHGIAAVMVQGFFATRIYYFFAGKALQDQTFNGLNVLHNWSLSLSAVTVATNIVIAVVQCVLLVRTPIKSKKTERMVMNLMEYSVITGVLTSIDAICTLATLAAMPDNFIYTFFFFSLGRLYSNSLLAALNNRKLEHAGTSQEHNTSSFGHGGGGGAMALTTIGGGVRPNISIKIDTTQEYNLDPHTSKSADTHLDVKQSDAHAL
ncbi:hypothetical protein EWM64_g8949 [Hericium alpestre]|uniref:DUF6534 domain-containing protein n=1 Tax=Hericium alpestre TaxID=135208 RepID=A0A4Y9ZJZ4_9AGAM|nr:hypothetical protein EWM64_g8949 [Hericium alpestre]